MSEQQQISQLSALFDGELPQEQAEMVIRRVMKDPALRATWGRYALIGACVRGEPLAMALPQVDMAARIRTRLMTEPEQELAAGSSIPASSATARASLWRRGALGGAIAASVALVSLVLVRQMAPSTAVPGAAAPVQVAQQAAPVATPAVPASVLLARESAPPSYTTPVDDSPARRTAPLFNYVAAHSDVAVSAVRLAPLSSVMGGGFDLTQDAVEMTAAEVGARR
jgi:negative regulator of sigma E activity